MLGNQLPCHPFGSVLHRRAPAPVEAALPHTALRQGAVLWVPITSPGPIQQLDFHRVEASDEGGAIGGVWVPKIPSTGSEQHERCPGDQIGKHALHR